MLNHYSFLKNATIVFLLALASLFALPNIYGEDPSIQISPTRDTKIDDALVNKITSALEKAQITPKRIERSDDRLLVRLDDTTQLKAKDVIDVALDNQYNSALNLAPALPSWLMALKLNRMYLGLDLRGGVHFLMEIDMNGVVSQILESHSDDLRTLFTKENITFTKIENKFHTPNTSDSSAENIAQNISIQFPSEEALLKAQTAINNNHSLASLTWKVEANQLIGSLSNAEITERSKNALEQNITTLRNRVNELGVAEPVIQQQGLNRIIVQLPGVQDTSKAKEILGTTATLEFRIVDEKSQTQAEAAAQTGKSPLGTKLFFTRNKVPYLLKRQVVLTGDSIIGASAGLDQNNLPQVAITLDTAGAEKFAEATKANIHKPMATVLIENRTLNVVENEASVKKVVTVEEIANVATIQTQLFKNFVITGISSMTEANNLALILRSGALAAPIKIIEERTVGPSTGKENIEKGFTASSYALLLVMTFMLLRYKAFGLVASVALFFNLVLIIALLSLLQATLTLPGIAGIILSLGMSVDANVLIYERIRENIRNGVSIQNAIDEGFNRALATIADANLTSLIAAIVLFGVGSGPIKGFAVTLTLGIVTSMFTAILVTRAIVNAIWGGKKLKSLPIGHKELLPFLSNKTNYNFMKGRKIYVLAALFFILATGATAVIKSFNFGLDFTGGTVIEMSFSKPVEIESLKADLNEAKIDSPQVQHFGSSHEVLIRLPIKKGIESAAVSTQVLNTIKGKYANVQTKRVEFVGPQVGNDLVKDGSLASFIAIALILVYIWVRFEWKLALGTILATVHDTFIIIGFFAIFRVEFDLSALAAILAVIGYSVNDTVVVIDRIRENLKEMRKDSTAEIINAAINQTMSRTVMTSLTTLIAVTTLYFFGGSSMEAFSLVMMIGITIGTYSSIFIAAAASVVLGLKKEDLFVTKKDDDSEYQGLP